MMSTVYFADTLFRGFDYMIPENGRGRKPIPFVDYLQMFPALMVLRVGGALFTDIGSVDRQ
jgi:hypothetical protein